MKLLQLNAWGGRLQDQVVDLLHKERPDIVCLQEAVDVRGGNAAFFLTIDDIPEDLNLSHRFFSASFTFDFMRRELGFGNCILSKFPISKQETIFTNLEHVSGFDFNDHDYNIRNLQHAVIETSQGKLNVLDHHGHHVHQHKNGDAQTMRQCKQIADYVSNLAGPTILTGDFNLSPGSESLGQINAVLINLSVQAGLKTTRTVLTKKTEVCDYIFVNELVKVSDFKAADEVVSDHKALIVEFDL